MGAHQRLGMRADNLGQRSKRAATRWIGEGVIWYEGIGCNGEDEKNIMVINIGTPRTPPSRWSVHVRIH